MQRHPLAVEHESGKDPFQFSDIPPHLERSAIMVGVRTILHRIQSFLLVSFHRCRETMLLFDLCFCNCCWLKHHFQSCPCPKIVGHLLLPLNHFLQVPSLFPAIIQVCSGSFPKKVVDSPDRQLLLSNRGQSFMPAFQKEDISLCFPVDFFF